MGNFPTTKFQFLKSLEEYRANKIKKEINIRLKFSKLVPLTWSLPKFFPGKMQILEMPLKCVSIYKRIFVPLMLVKNQFQLKKFSEVKKLQTCQSTFNPFSPNLSFLHALAASGDQRYNDVFNGYSNGTLG